MKRRFWGSMGLVLLGHFLAFLFGIPILLLVPPRSASLPELLTNWCMFILCLMAVMVFMARLGIIGYERGLCPSCRTEHEVEDLLIDACEELIRTREEKGEGGVR